jgi:hypothetical protein
MRQLELFAFILTAFLFAFYIVIFHMLSNLPIHKPLFLGVHKRFWMQVGCADVGTAPHMASCGSANTASS